MNNFEYWNPTRIVFGRGMIARLAELVPADAPVLMTAGGGSIRKNGVYDQVKQALAGHTLVEFWGIEPNPQYETCLKAVAEVKARKVGFLLAVGGGSVLDATKFIAAASVYEGADPWVMFKDRGASLRRAMPLGAVLTLPATGSEMNKNAVISREELQAKVAIINPVLHPRFSILDPEATFTLPPRQTANGIVDAFVHTVEQYLTYPVNSPLQDRQAEAVFRTLVEEGPKVMKAPEDYEARANVMWAATNALNGLLGCGVPGDWSTHMIGHEITALYGIDHAQSLAVVLPGVLQFQRARKRAKLLQYGERVWGIASGDEEARVDQAIAATESFFRSLGLGTRFKDYGISGEACARVAANQKQRNMKLSEHGDIEAAQIEAILKLRV